MSYYTRDEERDLSTLVRALIAAAIAGLALGLLTSCAGIRTLPNVDVCKVAPELCPTPAPGPAPSPTPAPEPSSTPEPVPTPTATPTPTPTPTPSSPFGPDDPYPVLTRGVSKEDDPSIVGLDRWAADLNSAINVACGSCNEGTALEDHVAFIRAVRDRLRTLGYQAGYDWEHGNADHTGSELSFWRGCRLESHQIVTSAKRVRRPGGSFRGYGDLGTCTGVCALQQPLGDLYRLELRFGRYAGKQYQATPVLVGQGGLIPPSGWTGACRKNECDVAIDKDYENGPTCTRSLCGEFVNWTLSHGTINWQDAYTVKVTLDGPAVLGGCCSEVPGVCGRLAVAP